MREALLPWLAVAALGAFHGAHPATGWLLATAHAVQQQRRGAVLRALLPIAAGHVLSLAAVALLVVAAGLVVDRTVLRFVACALLLVWAVAQLCGVRLPARAGHAGLAFWSFLVSSTHGMGLLLVAAVTPLCLSDGAMRSFSGSAPLVLLALAVHLTAMLIACGAASFAAYRILPLLPRGNVIWAGALLASGVLLLAPL